ncbi:hypothetical protein COX24_02530 [bacterium (Candidatus Gribaldobacteria) CG23_combo_of_CG06-09_8_20_14_all_37_87_8]|uniref:Uncharacterized protein n=2 Tax=Candidatus Gribaldobacteria TaxID=2798536 RepID=A0A2G9ZEN1_9BACT|nr:MAG: hypothetical protein AUJ25_01765 [Parcubacteria group bacterium CG1_02_37_13]PIP31629.1 MAG: hypothetical protein COX24_02530 [bacterium (Candidatus Gribaldobacteria) CG23_combo_of_CG06-09_8_20_14_all_37_87_8]PIR90801.1 MAG: hypothetical protein COU05_00040 [bacterium (Candidatus Gribaldobacteria) CG10_big_fil_rev_8_21_14_0_10_37_21]
MVTKLCLPQFYLFSHCFVRLHKKLFNVAKLHLQTFLLAFLASLENLKFRDEMVLQPSQYNNKPFIKQKARLCRVGL